MREVLLIHGGGVGPWMWRALRAELGDEVVVHAPALPGHVPGDGGSYAGPGAAADAVADAVAGSVAERSDLVVAGFSAGGQVALEFAARYPERVGSLVVVSSLVEPLRGRGLLVALGRLSAPLAAREGFARRQAAALGIDPLDVEDYVTGSVAFSRESFTTLLQTNFSYTAPARVRPALLMAGGREQRVLRTGLQRLADRTGARYREVPDAGHDIPMRSAALLADELRALL